MKVRPLTALLTVFVTCAAAADAPPPAPPPAEQTPAVPLPAAVDLGPEFARHGLKQRSQGRRDTCSVFAVTEAVEFALAKASGQGRHLSVEFANWAANEATGRGDDGDFFANILKGLRKHGACAEEAMPYQRRFSAETAPSPAAVEEAAALKREWDFRVEWLKPWRREVGLTAEDLRKVKEVLASGHPVCAGSPHSILFVGYQDDPALPGGGKLLISDSNLVEREISYQGAMERFNDLLWIRAERRKTE